MKKFRKTLSLILVIATMMSMAVLFTACNNNQNDDPKETTTGATQGAVETGTYSISVETMGGMVLSGIDVYIYADDTLTDLKNAGKTNEYGKVSFELPKGNSYVVSLSGVPKGYEVDSSYPFTGNAAEIVLNSSLVKDESLAGANLGLGDVMYDFTVTTSKGETLTLSEVLEEKKMVLLNFWYTTCTWCLTEFPIMDEVYQQYSDEIEIIALDPLDGAAAVKSFQEQYGYSFPMADCQASWAATFGIQGYPTSVMIDRYGVICVVESGAITSQRPFICAFDHFIADEYEQKLCVNGVADLVTTQKPTHTMDTSENIGALINSGDIKVTYRPEDGEEADITWPFIAAQKNGVDCLKASNSEVDDSYAIIYADVELKAGQAIGFDYLVSSERYSDIMYVIVNDEDIYQISGVADVEEWKSCYPCVAEEDGVYELALCYLKDGSTNEGDDTVYIKNMRVLDAKDIDTATYLPREAATTKDGFEFDYAEVVLNANDGYYHVGSPEGPLLLADLMSVTQFNEENSVYLMVYEDGLTVDGVDYYEALEQNANYASNAALTGVCTVTEELADLLKMVADVYGFDEDENEWLKICKYYQAYGTDGEQLVDPIAGLAPFSAYTATLGTNVETNYFLYDRVIMPRGLFAKFVPETSGVYRITSRSESQNGVDGWIFNKNREELLVYQQDERNYNDSDNVSMIYYMEAGEEYYIDIAFWDVYETGYIYYDIEYLGAEKDIFTLASPGPFTYDSDATGENMYHVIAGGIKAVLKDGYYYHDLGKDANGNQIYGSLIYADFTGVTSLFSNPITSVPSYNADGTPELDADGNPVMIKGMIELSGFDFTKSESDLEILAYLKKNDNDIEKTVQYLKDMWGSEYEDYAEIYQIEDVFEGIYHGEGGDLTEEISSYLSQIIQTEGDTNGCVPVDERLAEILQLLMEKYTFKNVDQAWLKLCYYFKHYGN